MRVNTHGRHQLVIRRLACSYGLPALVVQQEVMMPAEQNARLDVGRPAVALPLVDVVRFGLARV